VGWINLSVLSHGHDYTPALPWPTFCAAFYKNAVDTIMAESQVVAKFESRSPEGAFRGGLFGTESLENVVVFGFISG
jgi:hypothetical protein